MILITESFFSPHYVYFVFIPTSVTYCFANNIDTSTKLNFKNSILEGWFNDYLNFIIESSFILLLIITNRTLITVKTVKDSSTALDILATLLLFSKRDCTLSGTRTFIFFPNIFVVLWLCLLADVNLFLFVKFLLGGIIILLIM